MKVLTIQSKKLNINGKVFPNGNCNHESALEVYKHLFSDYNKKKSTNYENFFWAFSDLQCKTLEKALELAPAMIGFDELESQKAYVLEVPNDLCLETDFYGFADEIYAHRFPNELSSIWESIYDLSDVHAEKQVIFPYISKEMILKELHYDEKKGWYEV